MPKPIRALLIGPGNLTRHYARVQELDPATTVHANNNGDLWGRRLAGYDLVEVITHPDMPWLSGPYVLAALDVLRLQQAAEADQSEWPYIHQGSTPVAYKSSRLRAFWLRRRRCILAALTGGGVTLALIMVTLRYWPL